MNEALNIDKRNKQLHSLHVICETNLLSILSPWSDNILSNTNENATIPILQKKFETKQGLSVLDWASIFFAEVI